VRILFLTSRFPYPLEKGDKLRAFYQIAGLSRRHEIILVSVSDQPVSEEHFNELKPFCKKIVLHQIGKGKQIRNIIRAFLSGKPFQVEYFFDKELKRKIALIIKEDKPDAVFCQLVRMAEYVKDENHITKTLDYQDAFSKGYERMAERSSLFMKIPLRMEHKRLAKYEGEVFDKFDHKIIISEQDRKLISHLNNNQIQIIPNGVDFDYWHPTDEEKKYDMIFAGNMNYPPNIESALFIANEVMPLLLKKKEDVRLVIAGANPSKEILKLNSDHIIVTGWVDDMRIYFAQSKIHLAPMLISIGLQNKILQAMAMKIPCIVSTLANNAIHAPAGDCLLIADNPKEYVDAILYLLDDKEAADRLAESSFQFVLNNFGWDKVVRQMEEIILND